MEPLLRVLGPLQVTRNGAVVPVGGPNVRMTLALLVANRSAVVSVDRIADALWGDTPPRSAVTTVQGNVSRLRRILEPEVQISARAPGYVLEVDADEVDSGRFEAQVREAATAEPITAESLLSRALAGWRGQAFEEFADREWARGEAARLDELRVIALEELMEARFALGEHRALVGELERQVLDHPLRERFWRQLMLALYRSGRQGEALRRANEYRRILRDDMGLEPSAELRALESRIIEDDAALTLADATETGTVHGAPHTDATRFFGRDEDLTDIAGLLAARRVVTLTGPGGVGKTRLAMQIATTESRASQPVCVVELAHARDERSAIQAIAAALDVQQRQHLSLESTLIEHLRDRRMLVVLDNCEHLLDWVGPFVDRVRNASENVGILATSREPLGLPGERIWVVGPLDTPYPEARTPADVGRFGAVQLFLDRAAAAQPGFTLTADNAAAVAEVCRRVDGLPLALELAAARVRTMSPETLADRLRQRLDVLGATQRGAFERHRTLRAAIQWSYELLTPAEQDVFAQLAVFVGGFDLEAAEHVCAPTSGGGAVPDLLANLVDKSMVQIVDLRQSRYRILETLGEFGLEELANRGSGDDVRRRHTAWYVDVAERSASGLAGPDEGEASIRLEQDFENCREAHASAVARHDLNSAVRLVCAVREFAFRRMRYEVSAWAEDTMALSDADDHPRAAVVVGIEAYGAFVRGDLDAAIALGERAVDLGKPGGATSGLAERALSNAIFYQGDPDRALEWMDRMVASARDSGSATRLTHALYMRSVAATSVGDPELGSQYADEAEHAAAESANATARAQARYAAGLVLEGDTPDAALVALTESAEYARQARNRWVEAFALTEVFWLEARRGEPQAALAGFASVVETWYRGGDWANQWLSLRHVCGIFAQVGAHRSAAVLYGAIAAAGAAIALPFEPSDAELLGGLVDELRAILGAAEFAAAVREGAATGDAALVQFVQDEIRRLTT